MGGGIQDQMITPNAVDVAPAQICIGHHMYHEVALPSSLSPYIKILPINRETHLFSSSNTLPVGLQTRAISRSAADCREHQH